MAYTRIAYLVKLTLCSYQPLTFEEKFAILVNASARSHSRTTPDEKMAVAGIKV